ncbi:MAG: PilZ domain-containing protein [Nitrospirota bacterium]|nr:MAG: PilZ domain-containing protein [Nitrospirota bacterium]
MPVRRHSRTYLSGVADVWTSDRKSLSDIIGTRMAFCLIKNISVSGLGVFTTTPLQVGSVVAIDRLSFNKRVYSDRLFGTVAWVSGKDRAYNVGIRFQDSINKYKHTALYSDLFGNSVASGGFSGFGN